MDILITEAIEQTIARLLNAEKVIADCEASLQVAGVVFKREPDGAPSWTFQPVATADEQAKRP